MSYEIVIENLQKKISLKIPLIKKVVKIVLKQERVKNAVLSIVFVSSQKIRAMNIKYLGRAYVTDVLAFDLSDEKKDRESISGDIIISTDAVVQNSREFKTSEKHELMLYIIHGILHLLGYDDHTQKDIVKMRKRESELIEIVKR